MGQRQQTRSRRQEGRKRGDGVQQLGGRLPALHGFLRRRPLCQRFHQRRPSALCNSSTVRHGRRRRALGHLELHTSGQGSSGRRRGRRVAAAPASPGGGSTCASPATVASSCGPARAGACGPRQAGSTAISPAHLFLAAVRPQRIALQPPHAGHALHGQPAIQPCSGWLHQSALLEPLLLLQAQAQAGSHHGGQEVVRAAPPGSTRLGRPDP